MLIPKEQDLGGEGKSIPINGGVERALNGEDLEGQSREKSDESGLSYRRQRPLGKPSKGRTANGK